MQNEMSWKEKIHNQRQKEEKKFRDQKAAKLLQEKGI